MQRLRFILVFSFLLLTLFLGYLYAGDCYTVGEETIHPGFERFTFYVIDACGNYEGNLLRVKISHNAPEGISLSMYYGLSVFPADPNWLLVDDAVFDSNSMDPNLYGSFMIGKPWRNRDYEFTITVADSADNNSCGTSYIYSWDRGKPKVTGIKKYQK